MVYQSPDENQEQENEGIQNPQEQQAPPVPAVPPSAPQLSPTNIAQPQRQGSGRFTNLQKYIQANQQSGQKLGEKISQNLGSQAEQIRQGIQQSQQQFQQGAQNTQNILNQAQQFQQDIQQAGGAQGIVGDESKFKTFRDIYTGQVQNPQMNLEQAQSQLGKLQDVSGLSNTEQGRFRLLENVFSKPQAQYSTGKKRFDQLVLQNTPDVLRNVQQVGKEQFGQTEGLFKQTEQQQKQAQSEIAEIARQRQEQLKSSIGEFGEGKTGALGSTFQQLAQAKQQAEQQQANEIKELQDSIKAGKVNLNLAQKYGLNTAVDLGSDKIKDLVDYASDIYGTYKTSHSGINKDLEELDRLKMMQNVYKGSSDEAIINNRISQLEKELIRKGKWGNKYQTEIDKARSNRQGLYDVAKFGRAGVSEQSINQYYDQLQDQLTKQLASSKGNKVQRATEFDNIERLRQADLARMPELQEKFMSTSGINLGRYFKPEDLANLAANVQAKDAAISMADIANEEQMSRIDALEKLANLADINLGEKQGQVGAQFDFDPARQNIRDQLLDQLNKGTLTDYADFGGANKKFFDERAALFGLLTGGVPGAAIAGLSDTTKRTMDSTGITGNSDKRLLNYANPITTPAQIWRDIASGTDKLAQMGANITEPITTPIIDAGKEIIDTGKDLFDPGAVNSNEERAMAYLNPLTSAGQLVRDVENVGNKTIDFGSEFAQEQIEGLKSAVTNPQQFLTLGSLLSGSVPGYFAGNLANSYESGLDKAGLTNFQLTGNKELDRYLNYANPLTMGSSGVKEVQRATKKAADVIKNIFCFAAGTKFKMQDGSIKNVEDIKVNDIMFAGGKVYGIGQAICSDLYNYNGLVVSGNHAVIENDMWVRVKSSPAAKKLDLGETIVYPIANEQHVMIHESGLICADFDEVDSGQLLDEETRLKVMNEELSKNLKNAI